MAHEHNHDEISAAGGRALRINLAIALVIMVVEVIGGLLSNSLGLVSDAGHMLIDSVSLALSLFAISLARRPATATKTFGFYRAEILAALANGAILVLLSAFVFYESYQRILTPPKVNTTLMLIVAAIGFVSNFIGVLLLRRTGKMSLNIKSAFWHIVGDAVTSLGVIAAAIVIKFTGWSYADPVIAIFIGVVILIGAVQLVRESLDILLEAVPKQITVNAVIETLRKIKDVNDVHDIHVWTITSGIYAMSAHLVVKDLRVSECSGILEEADRTLAKNFNITHTTLQLECSTCASDNVCSISPQEH